MDATRWFLVLLGLLADILATCLVPRQLDPLWVFLRATNGLVFVAWVAVIAESVVTEGV